MADVRELWGASPWQGGNFDLLAEEVARIAHATLTSGMMFALPAQITETSPDGHSATLQPTVKRAVNDPTTGQKTYEDHPLYPDVPVHFAGGGGVTLTHPIAKGDEGTVLFLSRHISAWRQSGGSQQPIDHSINNPGDSILVPGLRSDPRKIQATSTTSAQLRSDDGHHTIDHHPTNGTTVKTVDPSTPVASSSFNPFAAATKFFAHILHPTNGVLGQAVDGGTTHDHGVTHETGAFMRAANALHSVLADPSNGASMNANNLLHQVKAHPSEGAVLSAEHGAHTVTASTSGVMLSSTTSIGLSAPSISLPSGSIGGSSLGSGAAASNIGPVGGDLSGSLPNPQVIGLGHVDAHTLPVAASDAAAGSAGVPIGGLYRNVSFVLAGGSSTTPSGISVLCVRMA